MNQHTDTDANANATDIPVTGEELVDTYPSYREEADVSLVDLPGHPAETVPGETVLHPDLAGPLDHDLYSHQAMALEALADDENVCVATSTASGKTLVYALQIARNYLAARRRGEESTAYVCYPTKALSRDQERELNDLFDDLGLEIDVAVYDGDTERGEPRKRIREEADVVISNFAGVNTYLHDHDRWARFFAACDLLVIDESHTYTGVHGMHVAWIVRRLKRVLAYYGSDPQFVLTSATIGNPGAHSSALIDEPITVVDEDGSPQGPRDLVLWNPPMRTGEEANGVDAISDDATAASASAGGASDDEPPERLPATIEAPQVFSHLTYHDAQTLLFTPSRKLAELSIERAGEHRRRRDRYYVTPDRGTALEPYHAGHSRKKRHGTEHQLKNGLLDGVASTNALELGINVGAMDATVQMGYPGQRQSFWQQIGRAGRGERRALSVLVAEHRTLDQYVVSHPEFLLETDVEDAVVDVDNDAVFAQHVRCAADELALDERDVGEFAECERLEGALEMWRRAGQVRGRLETGVSYTGPPRPQSSISLYATAGQEYEVRLAEGVDDRYDPEMEPLARERVFRDFHEGAVRLHAGQQYEVCEVDHDAPQPYVAVRPTNVDYYTQTRSEVTILDAESEESREINDTGFDLHYGTGTVLVYHGTYDKVAVHGGKPKDQAIPTDNPPLQMETQLCWLEVPQDVERHLVEEYREYSVPELESEAGLGPIPHIGYVGGLHAAEHAMIGVAPLELTLDKRDLGGLSTLTIDSHLAMDAPSAAETPGGDRAPRSIEAARATVRQLSNALEREPASGWFVYDGIEGGLGFSWAIYDEFEALARRAREHVADCDCGRIDGCPACVMDEQCGNDNVPLHRGAAVDIFDRLLGEGNSLEAADTADSERERRPTLFYS
ncbi:DEAD/DEAH box helicase [Halomontanus rarus]|uniref:DEAD/DEAH box helicase n=1 Tax=Halomontanus rarus TaxID=3034020 RepID=UPI0023E88F2B|nr:DEAD/DEAH box helicase [Halovivax sp. TS33]